MIASDTHQPCTVLHPEDGSFDPGTARKGENASE